MKMDPHQSLCKCKRMHSKSLDSTYPGPFLTFVFCVEQMWRLRKNLVLEYEAAYQINDGDHYVIQRARLGV